MRVASGLIVAAEKVDILPCVAGGEEYRVEFVLILRWWIWGEVPPIFVSRRG